VAVRDVRDNPVLGDGAGGYRLSYDRHRDSPNQNLHDAHSVELEVLSELGIPGFLLWVTGIVGAFGAAFSARRFGPGSAAVSAVALTAAAYWLTHTSLDWFWPYPVVTGPVFGMLGAAAGRPSPPAGAPDAPEPHRGRRWRLGLTVAAALLAVSLIPPFLSARYVDDAYRSWRSNPQRAADDLDRARSLNPLSIEPLLAEGAIAQASGQRSKAISAFAEAARKRPEEWSTHYFLGQLYSREQPGRALDAARRANELNPLSPRVNQLLKSLQERQSQGADRSAGAS
jgi:O-antigen ligase